MSHSIRTRRGARLTAAAALAATAVAVPLCTSSTANARPAQPGSGAPALAAVAHTIVINGQGYLASFAPGTLTINRGDTLFVRNNDRTSRHTFTSTASGGGGAPLFNVSVPAGQTVAVPVAGALAAGRYGYYCTIHTSMHGTLLVRGAGGGVTAAPTRFRQALTFPTVLRGAKSRIVVRQAYVQVMPTGPKTLMWTYGGSYPGPTIRRPAGRRTKVTFVNDLPAAAGPITVHLHGDHHAASSDGLPDNALIATGRSRTYDYRLKNSKHASPEATDFYHDHRMGMTGRNVWNGLEGMFVVDNKSQAKRLKLPSGRYDLPLMFSNRSLTVSNQLVSVASMHRAVPDDASVGNLELVNGRYAPYAKVATHRYRLRLVNGANYTNYTFTLSDHRRFTQIGTGDDLLPRSVRRSSIPLGPGQRADVIVDFRGELHRNVVLLSGGKQIMEFKVGKRAKDRARIATTLAKPPAIKAPKKVSAKLIFGQRGGSSPAWTINGRTFDPRRVDVTVPLNSTRTWLLRNDTTQVHYVHLHEEQWHTLARDGRRPPKWERGLEDTWRLGPHESVKVAAKFTDYTGVFMIHCHMLDHEDDGMMTQFAVVRRGRGHAHASLPAGYYAAGSPAPAGDGGGGSMAMGVRATAISAMTPTSLLSMTGMSGMAGMSTSAAAPTATPAALGSAGGPLDTTLGGGQAGEDGLAAWQRMAITMSVLIGFGALAWLLGALALWRRARDQRALTTR